MLRLFVALPVPADAAERLASLRAELPGARWLARENYHLTLRFLGDVDEAAVPVLTEALARVTMRPLRVELDAVGVFPSLRRPRVFVARGAAGLALERLQARVERAVVEAGFEPDARPFRPHVTLARLRRPDRAALAAYLEAHSLRLGWRARSFALYESRLGAGGARYVPVVSWQAGA